jgi:hypothetical protein
LHGGRYYAVQLGDPEQGTHSGLLGLENGTANAALPGTVRQALTAQAQLGRLAESKYGATVFWHASKLGLQDIVSKREGTHRSGRLVDYLKPWPETPPS